MGKCILCVRMLFSTSANTYVLPRTRKRSRKSKEVLDVVLLSSCCGCQDAHASLAQTRFTCVSFFGSFRNKTGIFKMTWIAKSQNTKRVRKVTHEYEREPSSDPLTRFCILNLFLLASEAPHHRNHGCGPFAALRRGF